MLKALENVIWYSIAYLLVLAFIVLLLQDGTVFNHNFPTVQKRPVDTLEVKMKQLAQCESGNNPKAIHYWDGDSHSYGLYQWKIESIHYYNQKYKLLPDVEKHEIENIIFDPHIQDTFTRKVLSEPNGWKNWKNCWKKITS